MSKEKLDSHVIKPNVVMFSGETECRLIGESSEQELDGMISDIEDYITNNEGLDKSEETKDALYGTAIEQWKKYAHTVKGVKFTFYLNRKQYQFLTDLLLKRLEYDVDTVFLAINLTNMLGKWKAVESHTSDDVVNSYESNGTEITYIYHLIAKYTNKGLDSNAYRFAEILTKIGDISKIIKYYDTSAQNMSSSIQKWAAGFDANIEGEVGVIEESDSKQD